MNQRIIFVVLALIAATGIFYCQSAPDDEALLSASRKVTDGYMGELRMALSSAMSQGGVTGAVDVCAELAPEVAKKYSSSKGWEVKRVSEKFRNKDNSPDDFEAKVLKVLSERSPNHDEYYEWIVEDEVKTFRYLKAIRTGTMCLNCHGDAANFSDELKQVLSTKYPGDNAVGFKEGDFRGAFSIKIKWPEGKAGVDSINQAT